MITHGGEGITPLHSKSSFRTHLRPLSLSFLHNKPIVPISSLSPRLCDNSASVHFSAFCNNFYGNNSTPNVVIESAISIFDVRSDSSRVFAMLLRTLQDCHLMSAHWCILHSTHSGNTHTCTRTHAHTPIDYQYCTLLPHALHQLWFAKRLPSLRQSYSHLPCRGRFTLHALFSRVTPEVGCQNRRGAQRSLQGKLIAV